MRNCTLIRHNMIHSPLANWHSAGNSNALKYFYIPQTLLAWWEAVLILENSATNTLNGCSPDVTSPCVLEYWNCIIVAKGWVGSVLQLLLGSVTAACDIFCVCVDDSKGGRNGACCNSSFICKCKHTHISTHTVMPYEQASTQNTHAAVGVILLSHLLQSSHRHVPYRGWFRYRHMPIILIPLLPSPYHLLPPISSRTYWTV